MKKKVLMGYIKTKEDFIKLGKVMKANAPEKIYISPLPNHSDGYVGVAWDEPHKTMVEYIRTDAFIEKAKKWFEKQNEWFDPNGNRHCDLNDFEDFKNYMEGE